MMRKKQWEAANSAKSDAPSNSTAGATDVLGTLTDENIRLREINVELLVMLKRAEKIAEDVRDEIRAAIQKAKMEE